MANTSSQTIKIGFIVNIITTIGQPMTSAVTENERRQTMSDLIERDKAIDVLDDFQSNVENCVGNAYAIARQQMIDIPSAEPSWADALAELHERFDALEKEIRKASAEMSAIIREYVDRPQGEWMSEGRVYPPTNAYHSAYCSHCGEWSEYLTDYCGNCGADMRGERADEHGRNKSADRQ